MSNTRHWARRFLRHTVALSALAALAACAGDGPTETPAPPAPPLTPTPSPEPAPPAPTPTTGAITVSLEGVPTGARPTIILRSGSFERVVREGRTVDSLPPGEYEVRAEPLDVAGAMWDAEPATQVVNVRANQAAPRISIRFRRRGASLVLSATGIPSYARGAVRITDPQGGQRTALTGDTVGGLSAGQYTLTTEGLETTDGRFEAVPSSRTVTLSANATQVVLFTYGPAKASLTVSAIGLPGSALAGIAVTGPSGFSDRVDATRTIGGLNPGVYAARAARVASGGFSYDPDATYRDAALSGTQQRTLAFAYQLASGAIAVSVSGLPGGVSANVIVSGPSGFSRSITGTQTLTDLAPGAYRITADAVSSEGISFSAQTTVIDVVVSPSLVALPAEVVYRGSVGALAVSVTGLPPTATALVKVTRPNGQVTWIPESRTLEGLAPGQYLLEAQSVTGTSESWDPDITSRQVQVRADQRTETGVRYTPRSGSLTVSILGLPSGLPASVRVTGPASTDRVLTTSTTLDGLPPGTYTVTAAGVSSGSTQYTASPASSTVSVTRGNTAAHTVSYGGQSTALTVNFNGLPAGLAPSATISGPNGFSRTLTVSTVLENLAPGTYRITSARVATSSAWYDATPAALDVSLSAGQRATAQVNYALTSGSLAVSVAGLPSGTSGAVTITGPNGYAATVTATQTFTRLVPGSYTVTATSVAANGATYTPTPLTRTLTVSASLVAAAAPVTYGAAVGAVRVTMSGLPAATTGAATLLGPGGATRALSQTTISTGLAAGAWEVRGNTVTVLGDRHEATPASRAVTVLANDTIDAPITFARVTGHLTVTVSGLPVGTASNTTVTGPLGYTRTVSASQTLVGLEVGTYTITTAAVSVGATVYTPSATTQSVSVTAGSTLTRTVTYTGNTTSLTLTISGVPAGASGSVLVTGPNGFSQTVGASTTLSELATGTYTLTANTITSGGYSYSGTTATPTVTLLTGETRSATVTYAATTGRLTVSISGLPTGTNTAVTVSGPNSYSQAVTTSTTLGSLPPGTYTVAAANVTAGATLYTPSATSQTIAVTAGATASRSVAYSGTGTSIALTIGGLPSGVNGSVLVTGPSGFSQTRTATGTMTGLTAGTYTITASSVASGGFTYAGTPATQTVTIASGEARSATVTYAATTGRLSVSSSGLPSGTNAAITVTGPGSYLQAVTVSTTLNNLAAGSYTVSASNVSVSGTTYIPSATSQSVSVTAGTTAARSVTYASSEGSSPNLVLEGAHVTQAIQNFAGTVPLVAGREALLRVFVTTPSTNALQPSVRVRLYDGASLFRTFTITAPTTSVPASVVEGTLNNSWNATLTASDMRVNLRLLVDVDPTNTITEPDETDNVWPRTGTATLDVRTVAPFNLVFVPVRHSVNDLTGNISTSNMEGTFLSLTRRMFPLREINASVRATYTTNAAELQSNDANGAWLTVLSEMNALRVADGSAAHYYGIVNTTYGSGIAGYAYVPGRAGVGWDKSGSANRVTAHELGHNFGRRHVAACGSGNTDVNYPYAGGVIGNVGFNQGTGALVASSATDIMGYCSTQWISDYTWSNVMSYRGPAAAIAGFMTGPQPVLMVWGRVHNGVVTLEPALRMVTRPVVADRPGRYRLELRDTLGRTMTGFTFTPDDIDHNGDAQAFAFAVPLDAVTESRLVSVAIVGGANGTVVQTATPVMAAMTAGGERTPTLTSDDGTSQVTDPTATLVRSGSANRVTWDNATWPVAMVRDAASGQVLAYLRKSGDEFVPRAAAVRITFTNGIRSATREYTVR